MTKVIDMPTPLKPDDFIFKCECGYERFWITMVGFQCCGCGITVDFGEIEFGA